VRRQAWQRQQERKRKEHACKHSAKPICIHKIGHKIVAHSLSLHVLQFVMSVNSSLSMRQRFSLICLSPRPLAVRQFEDAATGYPSIIAQTP
ncbi:MAG: hypothetical protein OXB87_03270, partial [Hyphomicrobiales bacterium]|nr:hypothetical protein [Hyphomicrobiales bacterium]